MTAHNMFSTNVPLPKPSAPLLPSRVPLFLSSSSPDKSKHSTAP